ncbi:hypothetical protein O1611_g5329 [Lasiodiplodia mahajangana]|uniref:Uncharacterized protein n=1 Tax=Lasiodiplodia mahajangana TaxID=1108764 RepID=A0ACC2JLC3_9PEZI|nr:hypothetical protein O1611_g5329 [Lasiodiplodia mahajangana]
MNQGYSQYPQSRTPRPYNDELGRSGTPTSYNTRDYQGPAANDGYRNNRGSPAPQAGYGYGNPPPRMGTPGAQAGYGYNNARRSPAPQAEYRSPQRSRTRDEYTQQYPASRQEYSNNSYEGYGQPAPEQYAQPQPPTSPIRNNSGFDFNSGYSRPDSRSGSAPPQTANGGAAYPGYRSYRPAQDTQQPQQHAWEGI